MTRPYIVNPSVVTPAQWNGSSLVATLPPAIYGRRLTGISITGPSSARADFYYSAIVDYNKFDGTSRGYSNTADYSTPKPVPAGTSLICVWSGGTTSSTSTGSVTWFVSE